MIFSTALHIDYKTKLNPSFNMNHVLRVARMHENARYSRIPMSRSGEGFIHLVKLLEPIREIHGKAIEDKYYIDYIRTTRSSITEEEIRGLFHSVNHPTDDLKFVKRVSYKLSTSHHSCEKMHKDSRL